MAGNQETGQAGQKTAEDFLVKKGCKILARNFRAKPGEVDLIVKDGEYTVFVEVKCRKGLAYGLPREAVGGVKQRRIVNTAMYYLARHGLTDTDVRFDVVEVLLQNGQVYICHIEDAFGG